MNHSVWISGLRVISSIGMNTNENIDSLRNEKSGVGYPEFLHTLHKKDFPVCEIKKSNDELAEIAGMKKELPRTTYLSSIAAQEAINDAGIQVEGSTFRIGFISANTLGGMDTSEFFYEEFLKDNTQGHLRQVINHECGSISELVAKHLGIRHFVTTISTACSSSANSIIHGSRMIKHDMLDIVIAGGADALCRFTLNGFNTLMILDTEPCKPFDENRKGLNLGEGAGYVVLVSDKVKTALGLKTYAKVSGYANANDAFHQTASSPEGNGNYYAMSQALEMSGLHTNDIDYINAHGTGTSNNDSSEGIAIERLFGETIPMVSSTKANTGHTLGACGGIEAVYSCMAMNQNIIYPSLRITTPIKELNFIPISSLIESRDVKHVMSNSFGFGGNCTSLIFSKA